MNTLKITQAGAALLAGLLLAGCGGNSDEAGTTTGNPDSARTDTRASAPSLDARQLIEQATAAVEARKLVVETITPEDVLPPEYREGSETVVSDTRLALAMLKPVAGQDVNGVVAFIQAPAKAGDGEKSPESLSDTVFDDGSVSGPLFEPVRVVAKFSGLEPGPHGFHIHEIGDCSAPGKDSTGGHYNPGEASHGGPDMEERHVGDLGNLSADAFGVATLDASDPWLALADAKSIIGKALVVHAGQDDLSTQPDGNAGAPIACGVIETYLPDTGVVPAFD